MINQRDLNQLCTQHYRELPRRLTNTRTNAVLYTPSLSFCFWFLKIQSTSYGYIVVIIKALIIIIVVIIIIITIIIK